MTWMIMNKEALEMKAKGLSVSVSIKDTKVFKQLVDLLKEISVEEDVPQNIKDKINKYVNDLNDKSKD